MRRHIPIRVGGVNGLIRAFHPGTRHETTVKHIRVSHRRHRCLRQVVEPTPQVGVSSGTTSASSQKILNPSGSP